MPGGLGGSPWGGGPFGLDSWTKILLYDTLPDEWRAEDAVRGYPWKRYIQTIEPLFEAALARADHPEVLFGADTMRAVWLPLLARTLGLRIDQYYAEDWRRTSIRFANQWWARKGNKTSIEYLAAIYGFTVTVQEVWQAAGNLTFTPPPARPVFDEFPLDWIPLDVTRPRGSRDAIASWLSPYAGMAAGAVTWAASTTVTGTGFLSKIGPVGTVLTGVFLLNSIDGVWAEVSEVLSNTSLKLSAAWGGSIGVDAGARLYPESTRLTGLTRAYGPGWGASSLTGTVTFVTGSPQVTGSGTRFIDELGSYLDRDEEVFIWLAADRAWSKVLVVESQTRLILGSDYPLTGGTGAGGYTTTPNGDRALKGAGTAYVAEIGSCARKTWFQLQSDQGWNPMASVVDNDDALLYPTYPLTGGLSLARVSVEGRVQLYDQMEDCEYCKTDFIYVSFTSDMSEALTGTLTIVMGSDQVVGVGTFFETEIDLGEAYIKVDTDTLWRKVKSVEDDTHLTLDAPATAGAAGAAHWTPRSADVTGIELAKAVNRVMAKLVVYTKPVHVRMLVNFDVPIPVPAFVISSSLTVDTENAIAGLLGKRFDLIPMDGIDVDDPWVVTMTVSSP